MDPATPARNGRRYPAWPRALRIQGQRAFWRITRLAGSYRADRASPATLLGRSEPPAQGPDAGAATPLRKPFQVVRLQLQRLVLRVPRPSAKNRAWGVAALTGTAGIILLFLMYQAGRDAAVAAAPPDAAPASPETEDDSEPAPLLPLDAPLLSLDDEPAPPLDIDLDSFEEEPPAVAEPESTLSLNLALLRLPADAPAEFLVESAPAEDRPVAEPFAALPADDWIGWEFNRSRPAADPVLYADRLSPDLLQQLSAEIAVPEEPAAATVNSELNVAIEKLLPGAANAGEVLSYDILVRNDGERELTQALVEEHLPPAHHVVDVSPRGILEGQTLRWQLRDLPAGEEQRITIQVLPTEEGRAESIAAVRSSVSVAASTLVQSIRLELEANVPERVRVGELCAIEFRVTNAGTAPATGIVLRNDLPEHLAHAVGRQLELAIGTLEAGESREVELRLLAAEVGTGENLAELVADGEIRERATGRVDVMARSLRVRRWGVPRVTVGRPTVFENHVINEGEQPLADVELVETVPAGYELVDVSDDAEYDPENRQVRWTIAIIEPRATVRLPITLRPTQPGALRTMLEAYTAEEATGPVSVRVEAIPQRPASPLTAVPCCR